MAKQVQLKSETLINGETYPKGKVLLVSESIRDSLVASGSGEDYVKPKSQPKE